MRRYGHHFAEELPQAVCHMDSDVVDAGTCIVMAIFTSGHAVLGGLLFFHFAFRR